MNITVLITLILIIAVLIYIFISIQIIKRQQNSLVKAQERIELLQNECADLTIELRKLNDSYKKKEKVKNETKENLANIATSSTDDSVDRLQHPEKRRKPRTTNKDKNSST